MNDRRLLSATGYPAAEVSVLQRHDSEPKRHPLATLSPHKLQQQFSLAAGSGLEPCLRMSRVNIRSKKKVVFSETPCVIWNDDPPVIPPPDLIQSRRNDCDEEEAGEEEEEEEEGEVLAITAKERRRRKVVTAVAFTTFVLLTASALFVLVTLFHASAIDEVGTQYIHYTSTHPSIHQSTNCS